MVKYTYVDEEKTTIRVEDGPSIYHIPVNMSNYDYRKIYESGVTVQDYQKIVTEFEIDEELQKRINTLLSVSSKEEADRVINEGVREAVRLLRKGQNNWTQEEATRAATLEYVENSIYALEKKAAELKQTLPSDYQDNSYWV